MQESISFSSKQYMILDGLEIPVLTKIKHHLIVKGDAETKRRFQANGMEIETGLKFSILRDEKQ
ncbi:MAG: hypothetical protein ACFFD4_18005 [Candidatus Odinarchaeota archaeon]